MNTGKRMKRMKSDDPVATLYPMDLYAYSLGHWFINFVDQNFMFRLINLQISDFSSSRFFTSPDFSAI